MIKSPITGGEIKVVGEIEVSKIIKSYGNTDVSKFFNGLEKIQEVECLDTGYRFFYPLSLAGDGGYYSAISRGSKDERYYPSWKWENRMAIREIKSGDKILEIGCGKGSFLDKCKEIGAKCFGIELNKEAVKICTNKDLNVKNINIEDYDQDENNTFDCLCAFQVLEHLPDVKSFIINAERLLKTGGKLIIGVPNNDSFIKKDPFNRENTPPHHMGLWTLKSLIKITDYFDFSLKKINFEPLQSYHYQYFYNLKIGNWLRKFGIIGKILSKIFYIFIFYPFLFIFRNFIRGHTVVAIYQKK